MRRPQCMVAGATPQSADAAHVHATLVPTTVEVIVAAKNCSEIILLHNSEHCVTVAIHCW